MHILAFISFECKINSIEQSTHLESRAQHLFESHDKWILIQIFVLYNTFSCLLPLIRRSLSSTRRASARWPGFFGTSPDSARASSASRAGLAATTPLRTRRPGGSTFAICVAGRASPSRECGCGWKTGEAVTSGRRSRASPRSCGGAITSGLGCRSAR